jgi:hypothetical protein
MRFMSPLHMSVVRIWVSFYELAGSGDVSTGTRAIREAVTLRSGARLYAAVAGLDTLCRERQAFFATPSPEQQEERCSRTS